MKKNAIVARLILNKILDQLKIKSNLYSNSLFNGTSLDALIYYNLYLLTGDKFFYKKVQDCLLKVYSEIHETIDLSFFNGIAGELTVLYFFKRLKYIDFEDSQFKDIDDFLLGNINESNYDLQNGYLGFGLYFLEKKRCDFSSIYLDQIINVILKNAITSNDGTYWLYYAQNENGRSVNLGLLHGMSSIISFLSFSYPFVYNKPLIMNVIDKSIHYICNHMVVTDGLISFPSAVDQYDPYRFKSLSSYCSGELGIYYALLSSNNILRSSLVDSVLSRLGSKLYMKFSEDYKTKNYFFCHGMASVIYFLDDYCDDIDQDCLVILLNEILADIKLMDDVGLLSGFEGILLVIVKILRKKTIVYETGWERFLLLK